jgi:hypothetical protein
MLAESHLRKPDSTRRLNGGETLLITEMVRGTQFGERLLHSLAHVLVQDMEDGGMGSVRFFSPKQGEQHFGSQIAEASFVDADGVAVSATLNLDQNGDLFELDLFKADFSALRHYPAREAITLIRRDCSGQQPPD